MRVSCVLKVGDVENPISHVIVFPEGIDHEEITRACQLYPNCLIVGAVVEQGRSRGLLFHKGRNRIDYLKVETDGRTRGVGNVMQMPVYETDSLCVGVLICMDIDRQEFARTVTQTIRSSSRPLKLLCIPADMGDYWFSGESLVAPERFEGIYVVVCNHTKTHQARCKSFIADIKGKKVIVQKQTEPIHAELV